MNHYCLKHFLTLVLGDQQCFRNNSTQIGQFVKILINKTTNIYGVSWSFCSNMQPSVEIIRFDLQIKCRLQFMDYRIFISYPTSNTDYKYSGGTLDVSQKCSRERNWYLKIFPAWSYSRTQGLGFQLQILTTCRPSQELHFKSITSFGATWGKILQSKNRFKHEKQRHLVAKIQFRIFFV